MQGWAARGASLSLRHTRRRQDRPSDDRGGDPGSPDPLPRGRDAAHTQFLTTIRLAAVTAAW